jgi:hypothetical protein
VVVAVGLLVAANASAQRDIAATDIAISPDPAIAGQLVDIELTVANVGDVSDANTHAEIYPAMIKYECVECGPNGGYYYGAQLAYVRPPADGWVVSGSVDPGQCSFQCVDWSDDIDWNDLCYSRCSVGEMAPGATASYALGVPLLERRPPISTQLVVTPPPLGRDAIRHQPFLIGQPIGQWNVTGEIELVNDGSADPTQACAPLIGFTPGNVALVDRGTCGFTDKLIHAEAAGASAVLVANQDEQIWGNWWGGGTDLPTIPMMMIGYDDGQVLRTTGGTATISSVFPNGDQWQFLVAGIGDAQGWDPNPDNDTLGASFDEIFICLFTDNFESGDTTVWSTVVGD